MIVTFLGGIVGGVIGGFIGALYATKSVITVINRELEKLEDDE